MSYHQDREDMEAAKRKAIKDAQRDGMTVVRGEPGKILLDIDSPFHPAKEELVGRLATCPDLELLDHWKSKSRNLHAVIECPKWWAFSVRSATAALLGSDPIREKLNMEAFSQGVEEPALLFRPGPKWFNPSVAQIVKDGNKAIFQEAVDDALWYEVVHSLGVFRFPVPFEDLKGGRFGRVEKAVMLMRWIRKHLDNIEGAREES